MFYVLRLEMKYTIIPDGMGWSPALMDGKMGKIGAKRGVLAQVGLGGVIVGYFAHRIFYQQANRNILRGLFVPFPCMSLITESTS